MVTIDKDMFQGMVFCAVMETLTAAKDWPAVVMTAYRRFVPNMEHYADWRGEYLRVIHIYGPHRYEWRARYDVCNVATIRDQAGKAFAALGEAIRTEKEETER